MKETDGERGGKRIGVRGRSGRRRGEWEKRKNREE